VTDLDGSLVCAIEVYSSGYHYVNTLKNQIKT